MFVKMIQTLGTPQGAHIATRVYDVDDAIASEWLRKGIAEKSATPPAYIAEVLARLDDGAGRPCLFLPPAGQEFGHEVMTAVRLVHFHRASRKVVCCRPGTEVLYPSADEYVTDWTDPVPDRERIGTMRDATPLEWPALLARFPDHHPVSTGGFTLAQELYAIEPDQRITFWPNKRGLHADVALGIRDRDFAPERNWPREHWQRVADAITGAGLTFAVVGRRDTSFDLDGQQFHTGDFDTDAAVELLQSATLFVGSDSGAAHLASTIGTRMLTFRHHSSRVFVDRMAKVNPGRVEFLPHAWNDPNAIIARTLEILSGDSDLEVTTDQTPAGWREFTPLGPA